MATKFTRVISILFLAILFVLATSSNLIGYVVMVRLFYQYSRIEIHWSQTKEVSEIFKNCAEAIAIIGGAIWAYFKFLKGRTYQETLGLKISARCIAISPCNYLLITAEIKNIGASVVQIKDKGSAVSLWIYQPPATTSAVLTVDKNEMAAFPLVEQDLASAHNEQTLSEERILFYLEPNESIELERLITLPAEIQVAIRVTLSVASTGGYTWEAATIVQRNDKPEEKSNGGDGRDN